VPDEGIELLEGAGVEELLDPLARRQLALFVLLGDRLLEAEWTACSRSSRR